MTRTDAPLAADPLAIPRAPLRSGVRTRLLELVLRGECTPGASLREQELAQRLGVSRTPLREALLRLESEGFLRSEPGRGFFVRPLVADEVEELYPMLWTLEGLALRLAGPPSRQRLDELSRLNGRLSGARRRPDAALALDSEWHALLLVDNPNRRLAGTIAILKDQAFRYEYAYMRDSGRLITSINQHQEILDALVRRDLDAAVELLESNWRVSLDYLEPWLARDGHAAPRRSARPKPGRKARR